MIAHRLATRMVHDDSATQRFLLAFINFCLFSCGTFLLITYVWFLFRYLMAPKPSLEWWAWVLVISFFGGAVGAAGLWFIRRNRLPPARLM
jgi:hypothetical protein